jgi:hypothetical protein
MNRIQPRATADILSGSPVFADVVPLFVTQHHPLFPHSASDATLFSTLDILLVSPNHSHVSSVLLTNLVKIARPN